MKPLRLLSFLVIVSIAFLLAYHLQTDLASTFKETFLNELWKNYLFHMVFTMAGIVILQILSGFPKYAGILGFVYLGLLGGRILAFIGVFGTALFSNADSKTHLLAPIFLALIIEVWFVSLLLKNLGVKK